MWRLLQREVCGCHVKSSKQSGRLCCGRRKAVRICGMKNLDLIAVSEDSNNTDRNTVKIQPTGWRSHSGGQNLHLGGYKPCESSMRGWSTLGWSISSILFTIRVEVLAELPCWPYGSPVSNWKILWNFSMLHLFDLHCGRPRELEFRQWTDLTDLNTEKSCGSTQWEILGTFYVRVTRIYTMRVKNLMDVLKPDGRTLSMWWALWV